ncbi:MAG: hypothetical protein HUJ31_14450, partial [Pseudomonadales bacterium]|nr:hypothetical protein [Pseudomonadales bacterium]
MISRNVTNAFLERGVIGPVLLAALLFPVTGVAAERHYERKTFALTDLSGHLEEYLDNRDHNGKAVKHLRSQLYVDIDAYVYHPDILNLQFGVGGTHSRSSIEADSGGFESSDFSPDYRLRLNFVQTSSYPVSLYFDQSNPLNLATNVAVSRKETLKGMEFRLKPPMIPLNIFSSDISRRNTVLKRGSSLSQQQTDRLEVDANKTWNEWHKADFSLSWQEYSELTMDRTNSLGRARLNSDHLFGARNQVHLVTDLSYTAHEASGTESTTMTARPLVDWDVTDQLRVSFSTGFSREERTEYTTDSKSVRIGAAYRLSPSVTVSGFAMAQNEEGDQLNHDYVDLEGAIKFNRKVPGGILATNSSINLSDNDRWSSLGNLHDLDERLTLSGTHPQA